MPGNGEGINSPPLVKALCNAKSLKFCSPDANDIGSLGIQGVSVGWFVHQPAARLSNPDTRGQYLFYQRIVRGEIARVERQNL